MLELKKNLKSIITLIRHPIVTSNLLLKGSSNVYIGSRMKINNIRLLKIGNNVHIGNDSRFLMVKKYHGIIYSPSIVIEDDVYIANRFSALSAAPIVIKRRTLIASDVCIISENHGMDPELADSYAVIPLEAKPVTIGEGVWIGEKVCVLPGVEIGKRSIVAAGSVVTKSVPEYTVVGGVPAKILKIYNFEKKQWEKPYEF